MAGASDLFDAIKTYIPAGWDWDAGSANAWINAFCAGFVSMWTSGTTSAGVPPFPGTPPWSHTHVLATLDPSKIVAELATLGFGPAATFFSDLSSAISAYLLANSTINLDADGTITHSHILVTGKAFITFGTPTALKAAMLAAVTVTGVGVDPTFEAFSKGIIDFLTTNAGLSTGLGPTHVHVLTV